MKKFISLVLALVCVLSLMGCNNTSVTEETRPNEQEVAVGGDLIPMVFIDGQLYCDISEESSRTERVDAFDGEITSTVKRSEEPTEDNQSNFGTGYGYQYGPNGTIEVLINGKWWVFAIMVDAV